MGDKVGCETKHNWEDKEWVRDKGQGDKGLSKGLGDKAKLGDKERETLGEKEWETKRRPLRDKLETN